MAPKNKTGNVIYKKRQVGQKRDPRRQRLVLPGSSRHHALRFSSIEHDSGVTTPGSVSTGPKFDRHNTPVTKRQHHQPTDPSSLSHFVKQVSDQIKR
jgi:hypothetical protein